MKVAIVDSGVRSEHCVKLNKQDSKDFTGYGNVIMQDHGTFVAKIINYYAPGAQIVSMKVAHEGEDILEGTIIEALDYCIEKEVDIINLSLENGSKQECKGDCTLCDYIDAVVNETGTVVVTVSGNFGYLEGNTVGCPGRAEKAITVGAVNRESKLSESSGRGVPGFLKPNILAPGHVRILMENKLENVSGTSFAAPIITGILTSLIPTYGKDESITKIYATCTDLGYSKHEQGFGLLNIHKLLEVFDDEQAVLNSGAGQE
ncbi:S8 family peptidase [Bacillus cereus]|nr:S8 family serine peptidase [Bacillus cereus]